MVSSSQAGVYPRATCLLLLYLLTTRFILPLIWVAGFVTRTATVHVYWTTRRNTYSPGLLISLLYVIVFYLLIIYGLGPHLITGAYFAIGTTVGVATVGVFLTVEPTLLFPKLTEPRANVHRNLGEAK